MFPKGKHISIFRKRKKILTTGIEWNQSTDTWTKRTQDELVLAESVKWNQVHDSWTEKTQGV